MAETLTKAQLVALRAYEHAAHYRCIYWGSPKASAFLAALGFVEKYLPPSVAERPRMKVRPYRITAAGRTTLSDHQGDA